ncbi:hypothetical protein QQS21_004546 [Conoideocrella luteorostrata]|uniref:Uncharacterized protein n=1 Tax=Conoideocrella luteorostrata TaxID=1105319 RepID=A0AAJ0FZR6_9HYPO|nr:hypothetical protein QQS21_004546 [Conoideocrella luteorostrata]
MSKEAFHAMDQVESQRNTDVFSRGEMHLARVQEVEIFFNVIDIPGGKDPSPLWHFTKDWYLQINNLNSEKKTASSIDPYRYWGLPTSEVVVYCDYSRFFLDKKCFTGEANPGFACDTSVGIEYPIDQIFLECYHSMIISTEQVAWSQPSAGEGAPRQIQICPSYFRDFITNARSKINRQGGGTTPAFQVIEDLRHGVAGTGKWDNRWRESYRTLYPDKNPADMAMLGDGRMLYALLSTFPNAPGNADGPNSMSFKNCVRLSTTGDGVRAIHNADNYVYFAIGCALINAPSGAARLKFQESGRMHRISRSPDFGEPQTE